MTINTIRRFLPALLLAVIASGMACGGGAAQSYPSRNIRIVIPGSGQSERARVYCGSSRGSPGGRADIAKATALDADVAKGFGWSVIVRRVA